MSSANSASASSSTRGSDYAIEFGIKSRLDQIRLVRAAFDGVLAHVGVAESDAHLLSLAVAEILTNRIEHGYMGDPEQEIRVALRISTAEVQVQIRDNAPPLPEEALHRLTHDIGPAQEPTEEWTMRGHGLEIVRQIVDSVSVVTRNGENSLTLKKSVVLEA